MAGDDVRSQGIVVGRPNETPVAKLLEDMVDRVAVVVAPVGTALLS